MHTVATQQATATAKPFIKYCGGKSSLLPELLPRIPTYTGKYIEPFVGGGALFYAHQPNRAVLSDANTELINAYRCVRDELPALIEHLDVMPNRKDYFYAVREADRLQGWESTEAVQRAARFIYLNKTCFNGLHRTNQKGEFNTPFGSYAHPKICDRAVLAAASEALQGVTLCQGDYAIALHSAGHEDFVYLDPPYAPLKLSSFTGYGPEKFGVEEQIELATLCRRLDVRGVRFLLSNSDTPLVRKLYEGRFKIERVMVARAINSKGSDRGKVGEVLVSNYDF